MLLTGHEILGNHNTPDYVILQQQELRQYFPFGRHAKLYQYENLVKSRGESLSDYKIFTLIRNPKNLLPSMYRFRIKNFEKAKKRMSPGSKILYHVYSLNLNIFLLLILASYLVCILIPHRRVMKRYEFLGLSRHFLRNDSGITVKVFRLEDISKNSGLIFDFLGIDSSVSRTPQYNKTNHESEDRKTPWLLKQVSLLIYRNRIDKYYASEF